MKLENKLNPLSSELTQPRLPREVAILGDGFVGSYLFKALSQKKEEWGVPCSVTQLKGKITQKKAREDIRELFSDFSPQENTYSIIINAIGKVGVPNVEACEEERQETIFVNSILPLLLFEKAISLGSAFIHISSGCIFHGKGPFYPHELPNFFGSTYAVSKILGEAYLGAPWGVRCEIHRLRLPFTENRNPKSILMKLLEYPRILDVTNSLTSMSDYASFLWENKIVQTRGYETKGLGVYHAVNPWPISNREIIALIEEKTGSLQKEFVSEEEMKFSIPRATNTLGSPCLKRSTKDAIRSALEGVFT